MGVLYRNYRHSAASANAYRANPSAFLWRWGFQEWGGTNARMEMGTAAEAAVHAAYLRGLSPTDTYELAYNLHVSAMQGEIMDEARQAGECAVEFVAKMIEQDWGRLEAYNPKVWTNVEGLACQVAIRPDFVFERAILELKATGVMVKEPRPDHVRQVSLYAAQYERPGFLLYAVPEKTPKNPPKKNGKPKTKPTRSVMFEIGREDQIRAVESVLGDFRRIERFDNQFASARAATRVVPLYTDDFRWDEGDDIRATELWLSADMETME